MAEQRSVSLAFLVVAAAAAAAAVYGTTVHKAAVDSSLSLAARTEEDLGEATRICENMVRLRGAFSKRTDRSEKMLISFIEETATRNRISLASLTIDPGALKDASRISKFYREIDTTVRIKQVPLRNIILFLADIQTREPGLKPKLLSLMPSETDQEGWDARVVISYFVFDEEREGAATAPERTP